VFLLTPLMSPHSINALLTVVYLKSVGVVMRCYTKKFDGLLSGSKIYSYLLLNLSFSLSFFLSLSTSSRR